ncbi:DHA2 family efflux MFS transporter permease subunit [Lacticaseibacillus kribbianus]|uniref:DHA2 family efflux MFS transporter permease subunit n=1 Tax=Lacticaseibacillus kribbianus TaxID=2926292 RepID=UPI001CD5D80C|nr:DHA2 family efflux MFS transporter permease subunit [Lacticaseibacillus kribbianus]
MQTEQSQVTPRTLLAIFGTTGLAFCGVLVETSMNVTFPTLIQQFHTSMNAVQWVTTAYLLAVAATMVIAGYVQSRFTARSIIVTAGAAFAIGGVLCAVATNLPVMLLGRIIQAVGTGCAMPLVFALIMLQIPQRKQGMFNGLAGMVIALAPSLGPTYGGSIVQFTTWRLIFIITVPVGVIACLIAAKNVTQPYPVQKSKFALDQFALILVALIALTLAANTLGTAGPASVSFIAALIVAVLAFAGFIIRSLKSEHPILQVTIFKNHFFALAITIYFLIQFGRIGFTFLLPNFAQLTLGANSMVAGAMLLVGSIVSAIISPLAGRLMDSIGIKHLVRTGSVLLVIATLCFSLLASRLTVGLITGIFTVYLVGFSLMFNTLLTFGLQQLAPMQMGDGNAAYNTLQQYSGSLGTAIMAALLATGARFAPHANTVHQTLQGAKLGFYFMTAIMVIVLVLSWIVTSKKPAATEEEDINLMN